MTQLKTSMKADFQRCSSESGANKGINLFEAWVWGISEVLMARYLLAQYIFCFT